MYMICPCRSQACLGSHDNLTKKFCTYQGPSNNDNEIYPMSTSVLHNASIYHQGRSFQMKLYMLLLPTYYIIPVLIDATIPTLKNFKIKVNN